MSAHIGRAAVHGPYQIGDHFKTGGRLLPGNRCGDQTPADDFRFREMGFPRLGFQFLREFVRDTQHECLHDGFVIQEVRSCNTEGGESGVLSEVNRVAFGGEGGLVDDLAHGWVGVDGRVDFLGGKFLVEGEAHFRDEFGGVLADDVGT